MPSCDERKEIFCEFQGKIIIIVIQCKDSQGHVDLHQGDLPILVPAESGVAGEKKTQLQTFFWEQE